MGFSVGPRASDGVWVDRKDGRLMDGMHPCMGIVKVKTFFGEKFFYLTSVWIHQGKVERIWCSDTKNYKFKYDEEPFEIMYMMFTEKSSSERLKEDYEKLYNFVHDTSKVGVGVGLGGPLEGCSNEEKVYFIVGQARDLIKHEVAPIQIDKENE